MTNTILKENPPKKKAANIRTDKLHTFEGHPFQVNDNEEMDNLVESIKDPNDLEKWLIDEPAAEVVRKIYDLCIAGKGPAQIAKQLEREKILLPSAYYASLGRKTKQHIPENPYYWDQKTVVRILENRQYTGCAVNFKTTTVSYKVHKKIHNPVEEQVIIPNMQKPIISEEQWLRVQ